MVEFAVSVVIDLPAEDWPASETTKALERIALMASDQVERWEGAATVRRVTVCGDDGMVRVSL